MHSNFYTWFGLNEALFHAVNNVRQPWLDAFMLLGTAMGEHLLVVLYGPIIVTVATFFMVRHMRALRYTAAAQCLCAVLTFAAAFVIDAALLSYLKPHLNFPRPPLALGLSSVHLLGKIKDFHHSFPSGHASFAMTLVASLWVALPHGARVMGVFFVLWVALSRVYVGAHFPADVTAGAVSALLIVLAVRAATGPLSQKVVHWGAGRLALRARQR